MLTRILKKLQIQKFTKTNPLGLGLPPGAHHHRAYVGPPEDYDLISAMCFNLLTSLGLRQHHVVLDIGCGSLRLGRLLIPYLNRECYLGVDPNKWLIEDGINNEIGLDLIELKNPTFYFNDSITNFNSLSKIDFAIAQSIFSHCSINLIENWVYEVSIRLKSTGALLATYVSDHNNYEGDGWIYPGCVGYTEEKLSEIARKYKLKFQPLDWQHPRQKWIIFYKDSFDEKLIKNQIPSWNNMMLIKRNGNL
jgi:hypothetical protein